MGIEQQIISSYLIHKIVFVEAQDLRILLWAWR